MVNIELISMILFFIVVSILIIRDRKNIQFSYGIIIRRWKKGKELIDKFVNKRRRLIAYVGTAGVVAGLIASLIGMYFLVSCAFFPQFLPQQAVQEKCFKLVLPSVAGAEKYYPEQVFGIPFWYWLISVFIIIFFHESMHAVFARLEKVPVKSYGILFLLALPIGAFVDPDERKLKKLKTFSKLRIYAGGSLGNFILAIIVTGLILGTNYTTVNLFEASGVKFNDTLYNTPAFNASLSGVIQKINNVEVENVADLSVFLGGVKPNEAITVYTTVGIYNIKTSSNPSNESRAYIGINGAATAYKSKIFPNGYVSNLTINSIVSWQLFLMTLFILTIGIGIANMLPLKPFDGGLFFEEIFVKFFGKRRGKKLIILASWLVAILIVINLLFAPIKLF